MNETLKKQIWTVVGVLIIAVSFFLFFFNKATAPAQVVIAGTTINVEIAQTEAEREQGLSGNKPLADDEGMLFIFDKPGYHGFWMKDMLFSIDIIWISADKKIVHIETNLSPDTYPKSFSPFEPAQYVLEVNAGTATENVWTPGVQVEF